MPPPAQAMSSPSLRSPPASSPLCGLFSCRAQIEMQSRDAELMRCRLAEESVSQLSDREVNRLDLNVFFNLI